MPFFVIPSIVVPPRLVQFFCLLLQAVVWQVASVSAQLVTPVEDRRPGAEVASASTLIQWQAGQSQSTAPVAQSPATTPPPTVLENETARNLTTTQNLTTQPSLAAAAPASSPMHRDNSVRQAGFTEQPSNGNPNVLTPSGDPKKRRLAPPSPPATHSPDALFADRDALPFTLPKIESLTTAGAGLAIVVGLFLMCAWLLRRSGPKPTSPLPKEAVAVLGRVPLAARHFAHLLQLGNKLVLVSITPERVSTLAEVTEPQEVQRLLGLCLRNHKHSTTAEFHQVLEELANEPARGFLDNQAGAAYARSGKS